MSFRDFLSRKLLVEMPRLVTKLKGPQRKTTTRLRSILSAGGYDIVKTFSNGQVLIHAQGEYVLADMATQVCHYYFSYHIEHDSCVEDYLWRSDDAVIGITSYVFWDIVLKKFNCIKSDKEHTKSGKRFWLTQVDKAFTMGYNVSTSDGTKFTSMSEFYNGVNQFWGHGSKFEKIQIQICKG